MVYLPRFWGGLPFPPSRLVDMSVEMHMGKEPKNYPPPEPAKKFYSDPGSQKPLPLDVQRLIDSAPTPLSSSFKELSMGGTDDMLVRLALLSVLQDKTDVNYDVVKFIQHVLKFTPEDIPERAKGYMLNERHCDDYSNRTWNKNDTPHQQDIKGERACCHAFQDLVWDLVRQLQPSAKDTRSFPAVLRFLQDHVVEGDFASYKPDFGYGQSVDKHKWAFLGACGEMKKIRQSQCPSSRDRTITVDRIRQLKEPEGSKRQLINLPITLKDKNELPPPLKPLKPSKPSKRSTPPPSRHAMTTRAGARRKAAAPTEPAPRAVGTKRKATAEPTARISKKVKSGNTSTPNSSSSHEKRPLVEFTRAELQMAKYMNELLSHGIRAYAFGFLIQETCMTLWYADRMGLATSASFDMFVNPELLLLVTAALYAANRHQLGVIPLVKYPDGASQSHRNATLELPRATNSEGRAIKTQLLFALRVTKKTPLIVAYGAIGRGTTVVPITAKSGRAQTLFGKEKLVAKLSWPSVHRKSEADIIRVIRKKLGKHRTGKKYLKNIVDLKCSLDVSGMEIGLPRAFMDLSEPFEPRLLRTLVMKEYLPLEKIQSLNDFKTIYNHIFEAHHWVFEVVGMLHRDPSLNNFMFYYDKAGNVVGILSDWDVASSKEDLAALRDGLDKAERPEDTANIPPPKPETVDGADSEERSKNRDVSIERRPRYRTGTGPFMALDLLASTKIVHRYRHDLESFFYVLCFFCAQFRPPTLENPKAHFAFLPGWESGETAHVHKAKLSFLENHRGAFKMLFKNSDEQYLPLYDDWIWPLYKHMFQHISGLAGTLESSYGKMALALEQNDREMEELNMDKFRQANEEANNIITFEKFKEILSG